MHRARVLLASLSLAALPAGIARGQDPQNPAPTQASRDFVLGRKLGEDFERRAGLVYAPSALVYLQRIANRMAAAIPAKSFEVKVTRASDAYALLLPHGVLYLSAGLVERLANEAELAGLLAHELAHMHSTLPPAQSGTIPLLMPLCVFAPPMSPVPRAEQLRERERQATEAAVIALRGAGYDPSSVLDLFSKLVYEHPQWTKVMPPEDILNLRVAVEAQAPPQSGLITDTSEFMEQRGRIAEALRPPARNLTTPTLYRDAGRTP
jgi:predicted Zn-dependent protease